MDPRVQVLMTLGRMDGASYYELLAVCPGVARHDLQQAFHRFALAYHPDRHIDDDDEVREAAKRVFERGVEAYTVLRDQELARYYEERLADGHLRLTSEDFDRIAQRPRPRPVAPAPPPAQGLLPDDAFVDAMGTDAGREIARRVEGLVAQRRYRQAYLQLGLLETVEPDNETVRDRADKIAAYLERFGEHFG